MSSSGAPRGAPVRRVVCSRRWREMTRGDDRLLTAAEEIRVAKRIERGDLAAKREMIERNLRLVHSLPQKERGRGAAHTRPVQEGAIGLVRAPGKFKPLPGVKFSAYDILLV